MSLPSLFLKKNEDKRLRFGHAWVFSNEVDASKTPLDRFTPGELVRIHSYDGKVLGCGYLNPNVLICARLLSRASEFACDRSFFRDRLERALALRQKLFDRPYYRLVFGESDGLPGLVVDRFGPVLSVQITTLGMELRKELIVSVLKEVCDPKAIVLKNDSSQRQLEALPSVFEVAYGDIPDSLIIEENGARFLVDIENGQKTGWFYDHRLSRAYLAKLSRGRRVLDLFSYTGAWAIPAALAGASEVVCVDSSKAALQLADQNAKLNGIRNIQLIDSDVFEFLKQIRQTKQKYDVIVLDPPALVKRKKDFKQGYEAYRRLNQLALQILAKDGILVSASCSYHLSRDNLRELLRLSGRHIERRLVFIAHGGQGPDHPVDPAIPETDYLKTFFCSVTEFV